ncbi:hypothetical protein N7528_006387 [Penicillium herquei]|nr:hypothetical protein N7528_006387 [Penicillium herquei]
MFDEPMLATTVLENTNASSNLTSNTSSPSPSVDLGHLAEYSSHLLAQLIDIWFTHHPMCILLSKSLLLSDLHTNSAKPVLIAVLLADAHEFTKDHDAREQADKLLDWAIRKLQFLKPNAPDLTIAQAIIMIAWRQICWGQVRRAVCCVAYAGRITTQLKHQIHHAPILEQTHINGVDRGAVEAEMIQSLWWQTFCLCVWSFIQMNIEFNDLLPARLMQKLPPANEGESALLKLDRITGNIITKNAQTSSLQSVWLLAHTGSLAAYLYALYPKRGTGAFPSSSISNSWQNQILARLNDLVDRERGLAGICKDAREAIHDMVVCVNTNTQDNPAGHWLLVMYHTVSIHLLFPRPKLVSLTHQDTREDDNTERKSMTALEGSLTLTNGLELETFTGLETTLQGLITLFPHVQATCSSDKASRTAPAAFLHSYILGIDAVGRSLMQVLLAYNGVSLLHQQLLQEFIPRFLSCATALHELFNHDTLLRDHRWRLVKRQLKSACKGLEGISTTASSIVLPNSALTEIPSGHHYSSLPVVNNVGSGLWSGSECETGHAHHPGASAQDFPDFSLDFTPPMHEYFTGSNMRAITMLPMKAWQCICSKMPPR